jgi:hypothetical protein
LVGVEEVEDTVEETAAEEVGDTAAGEDIAEGTVAVVGGDMAEEGDTEGEEEDTVEGMAAAEVGDTAEEAGLEEGDAIVVEVEVEDTAEGTVAEGEGVGMEGMAAEMVAVEGRRGVTGGVIWAEAGEEVVIRVVGAAAVDGRLRIGEEAAAGEEGSEVDGAGDVEEAAVVAGRGTETGTERTGSRRRNLNFPLFGQWIAVIHELGTRRYVQNPTPLSANRASASTLPPRAPCGAHPGLLQPSSAQPWT